MITRVAQAARSRHPHVEAMCHFPSCPQAATTAFDQPFEQAGTAAIFLLPGFRCRRQIERTSQNRRLSDAMLSANASHALRLLAATFCTSLFAIVCCRWNQGAALGCCLASCFLLIPALRQMFTPEAGFPMRGSSKSRGTPAK